MQSMMGRMEPKSLKDLFPFPRYGASNIREAILLFRENQYIDWYSACITMALRWSCDFRSG